MADDEPAKKKPKLAANAADYVDNSQQVAFASLARKQASDIIEQIKEAISTPANADGDDTDHDNNGIATMITNASCGFLKLKSLQQKILNEMKQTHAILEKQRQQRDSEELKLENLKYEKALNDHAFQIANKLECPQLYKLCCDELGSEKDDSPIDIPTAESKVLTTFLGANPHELQSRTAIITKLNEEITKRSNLETQLKISQQKSANLKKSLAAKRKLLQELPLKLKDVERASQPLQKYCQKSLFSKDRDSRKLSSERRTNLDLAASLPKPLYTLYYQIQSYLDTLETTMTSAAAAAAGGATATSTAATTTHVMEQDSLPQLEVSADSSTVNLKIPIPTVTDGSTPSVATKKMVTIQFEFSERVGMMMADIVTNPPTGNDIMNLGLIGELFPADTGEWIGVGDEDDNENGSTRNNNNMKQRRPYYWCNYLAGLHIAPQQQTAAKSRISTKVIIQALIRRVRAMTVLQWLVHHNLGRKVHPIPVHSTMKDQLSLPGNNSVVKLSGWADQTVTGNNISSNTGQLSQIEKNFSTRMTRIYQVKLKRKSNQCLTMEVTINLGRYPSISPVWKVLPPAVNNESSATSTAPLYDDELAALVRKVNCNVLDLVSVEDETSCEWILSHQLQQFVVALSSEK